MYAFEKHVPFEKVLKDTPAITMHLDPQTIGELLDPVQYTGLAGEFVDRVLSDLG